MKARGYWFTADRDCILPDETLTQTVEAITLSTDERSGLHKIERSYEDVRALTDAYEDTITLEVLRPDLSGVAR